MRLDKTTLAVRERGMLEVLDLSLHVTRHYFVPLLITMAMGVAPLMLINYLLIGWMGNIDQETEFPLRYLWAHTLLIFIEAPLASVFATTFLGQAVFLEKPNIKAIFFDVMRSFTKILICQIALRGIAVAWLIPIFIERDITAEFAPEAMLLLLVAFWSMAVRVFRPFINEIVLLERSPISSTDQRVVTVARRSGMLHNPNAGDLFLYWMASAIIAVLLALSIYGTCMFTKGVFLINWEQGPIMVHLVYPLSLWLVALFFTVVRFLLYLDLRIRQEGWEVELSIRAAATQMEKKLV